MKQPVLLMLVNYAYEVFDFIFFIVFGFFGLFDCETWVLDADLLLVSLDEPTTDVFVLYFFQVLNIEIKKAMALSIPSLWSYNDSK